MIRWLVTLVCVIYSVCGMVATFHWQYPAFRPLTFVTAAGVLPLIIALHRSTSRQGLKLIHLGRSSHSRDNLWDFLLANSPVLRWGSAVMVVWVTLICLPLPVPALDGHPLLAFCTFIGQSAVLWYAVALPMTQQAPLTWQRARQDVQVSRAGF